MRKIACLNYNQKCSDSYVGVSGKFYIFLVKFEFINKFYAEERIESFKFEILPKYLMNRKDDSTVSSQQSKLLMNKYFIEGTQTSFNEVQ